MQLDFAIQQYDNLAKEKEELESKIDVLAMSSEDRIGSERERSGSMLSQIKALKDKIDGFKNALRENKKITKGDIRKFILEELGKLK